MSPPSPQQTAEERSYGTHMTVARPAVAETLASNLTALMQKRDWTQAQLAAKSGVSQRHISNVLRKMTSCSVESLEALAGAFGLPGWLLLISGIDVSLMDTSLIPRLVDYFVGAGPEGRELVSRLAEREFAHNPQKQKIIPLPRFKSRQ